MESAFCRRQEEHLACSFVVHPLFEVTYGVVDFFDGGEYLAEPRFETGLMEVLPYSFVKIVLALDNGIAEFFQFLNALLGGRQGDFPTVLPLFFENILDFYKFCIIHMM